MDFFRPQLSPWKEHDEYRLSIACKTESSFGWGSVADLGIVCAQDLRPLLSYAVTHRAGHGSGVFQMQAETVNESFTFMMRNNEFVEVYYRNYPIGTITTDFFAHDLNGNVVAKCMPGGTGAGLGVCHSAIGPARFEFASGMNGWFNIPPNGNYPASRNEFIRCRAIGINSRQWPNDYERRWIIALWIFLRIGPWTHEEWPTGMFDNFWDDIIGDILIPDQG